MGEESERFDEGLDGDWLGLHGHFFKNIVVYFLIIVTKNKATFIKKLASA